MLGTCEFMCPIAEVKFRRHHSLVHPLEVASCSSQKDSTQECRMVKEYRRSAAGVDRPHHSVLRPPHILRKTVSYLLTLFNRERKDNFDESYSFVSDRLRSVRQDIIIQKLSAEDTVKLLESMIPFYIDTEYHCRIYGCKTYNWKLHSTQLQECLTRWGELVHLVQEVDSEICSVFLLRRFCTESSFEDYNRLRSFLPPDLRKSVTDVMFAYSSGNFVRFYRLLRTMPAGFVRQSLNEAVFSLRTRTLTVITLGFKSPPSTLPLAYFVNSLSLEDECHARDILKHLNASSSEPIKVSSLNLSNLENISDTLSCLLFKCDDLVYS